MEIEARNNKEEKKNDQEMVLSLDISHDKHNRHDSYTAWTWLDIHASLRLLSLPISLTLSFVPWASSSNCIGLAPKQLS